MNAAMDAAADANAAAADASADQGPAWRRACSEPVDRAGQHYLHIRIAEHCS